MGTNQFGIKSLQVLSMAAVLGLATFASAQRDHGGWGGSHGGGYGSGHSGGYSRGPTHESVGTRSYSHYGTTHNVYQHTTVSDRVVIDRMPASGHYDPHGWEWNHHDLFHDGYRYGYYHYSRGWRDDSFHFGFYLFAPVGLWVYSPWYYYPCLPPYIAQDRVVVVHDEPESWGWNDGFHEYRWIEPTGPDGDYTDLDFALEDVKVAFEQHNNDAIARLCPQTGRVAVYNDGHYSYSMNSNDFYDTFKDGAVGPQTTSYRILDVKTNGHNVANVEAEQDYTDPWGKPTVVYHTYRLVQEGSNVVIRSFGTYHNRPW